MAKLSPITSTNIKDVKKIGPDHKGIFRLQASDTFVVKREQTDNTTAVAVSNSWANKVMRKASDGGSILKVKNMDNSEITAFLAYLAKPTVRAAIIAQGKSQQAKTNITYLLDGMQTDGTTALYVKLPFNPKLASGTDMDDLTTLNQAENVLLWYKAIDKSVFWKELGKISAIDHFNSNFDRIGHGYNASNGGWGVSNPGNIIVYAGKPLPIDAWNSGKFTNAEGDFTKDLDNNVKRGLDVMKNAGDLNTFGNEVMSSIINFLNVKAPLGQTKADVMVMKQRYGRDFVRGYLDSVAKIKEVMMRKIAQYGHDPVKKSMNPFAAKKPTVPSAQAIFGAKMGGNANAVAAKNNMPVPGQTIPKGLILRMEYLGWI